MMLAMPVTMQDVARVAGVSAKTVSNVVNGFPHIRAATKARVEAAIEELGYQVNSSARSLRSGRTRMITLAIPELNQPYFAELAQGVIDEAAEHGLDVLVETTGGIRERELAVLSGTRPQMVDGTIFSPITLDAEDMTRIGRKAPLVLIGEQLLANPVVSHVSMANVAAARLAVEHLIDVGCQRIAAIGVHPSGMAASVLRLDGYRAALDAAGLGFDPDLVVEATAWHRESGAEGVASLIDRGTVFDGVFCFNDALALGAMRELAGRRIIVPDEVAVVGFDDTEDSRYAVPALTTIDPGRVEIARTAVRLVAALLEGEPVEPREITVGFSLIARESTAR